MDTVFNLLEAEFPEPYHIATLQAVRDAARAVVKGAVRYTDKDMSLRVEAKLIDNLKDALERMEK